MSPTHADRRLAHGRRISCDAYARDDGLWDIESTLVDAKPFAITLPERGAVAAGEPLHEMVLRVTVDAALRIVAADAQTVSGPYRDCHAIGERYRLLVGLQIGPGFLAHAKRLFRGTGGCTHITELLAPLATTAIQALWWHRESSRGGPHMFDDDGSPSPIDGCHALRCEGEVVRVHFPRHYRPAKAALSGR